MAGFYTPPTFAAGSVPENSQGVLPSVLALRSDAEWTHFVTYDALAVIPQETPPGGLEELRQASRCWAVVRTGPNKAATVLGQGQQNLYDHDLMAVKFTLVPCKGGGVQVRVENTEMNREVFVSAVLSAVSQAP